MALKKTKDIIITHLKMYLNNEENYRHLVPKQLDVADIKGMSVYGIDPEHLRDFPTLIISGGSGSMVTTGLGDMAMEIYNDYGELEAYRYGGIYDFNLQAEIVTKSTLQREFLTDLVSKVLRFNIRRQMEAQGVLVQNVSYNSESSGQYDSNRIYIGTLGLKTWSEWYEDINLIPLSGVSIDSKISEEDDKSFKIEF